MMHTMLVYVFLKLPYSVPSQVCKPAFDWSLCGSHDLPTSCCLIWMLLYSRKFYFADICFNPLNCKAICTYFSWWTECCIDSLRVEVSWNTVNSFCFHAVLYTLHNYINSLNQRYKAVMKSLFYLYHVLTWQHCLIYVKCFCFMVYKFRIFWLDLFAGSG